MPKWEWQPIEKAPKDEQIVLAYFGPNKPFYGFVSVGKFFQWETMDRALPTGFPPNLDPTHFMPLPSPPEGA